MILLFTIHIHHDSNMFHNNALTPRARTAVLRLVKEHAQFVGQWINYVLIHIM